MTAVGRREALAPACAALAGPFAAFIRSEITRYADVIRRANVTAEG